MRNGIAKGIAAIFVAGVLAAGVCCTGFASRDDNGKWFGNGNISTWHWKDKTDDKTPDDKPNGDETVSSGGAIIGGFEDGGVQLLSAKLPIAAYAANGIDAQADTAYQITATVLPEETKDKTVDWAVEWVSPASSWASGKTVTDYVTVTPTSDGALTANVVCKQAFGEQVRLVVTSRGRRETTGSCTFDYARRISAGKATWTDPKTSEKVSLLSDGSVYTVQKNGKVCTNTATFSNESTYGVGTVDDEFTMSFYVNYTYDALDPLVQQGFRTYSGSANITADLVPYNSSDFCSFNYLFLRYALDTPTAEQYGVYNNIYFRSGTNWVNYVKAGQAIGEKVVANVKITFTGEYSIFTYSAPIKMDSEIFEVYASNINLSDSSIIF